MKADWDRYNQPVVEIPQKTDHVAALRDCKYPSRTYDAIEQNLAAAYLERDRQVKELRELAKAAEISDQTRAEIQTLCAAITGEE